MVHKTDTIEHALTFIHGGMSKEELELLYDVSKNKRVLELGSYLGMSSYVIASVARHLDCVDMWDDKFDFLSASQQEAYHSQTDGGIFEKFNQNCSTFISEGLVTIHRGFTKDMVGDFKNESFDVLLIDADHEEEGVKRDFDLYYEKVVLGGHILFHDYGDSMWKGVKKVCDIIEGNGKIGLIKTTGRLAVFKKRECYANA